MSTLGNTTTPASGWAWPGSGYAFATSFTTPSGGGILISTIHAYFATPSGASTGYVCVWDNSGNLLGDVNIGALPAGTQAAGGQSWQSGNLATKLYVAASTAIWIGGYGTGNVVFSSESSGTSNKKSMGSGGPGSFASSSSSGIGGAGAYVDYVNAGAWVYNGSAWVAGEVQTWNGSSWVPAEIDVYNGSAWNPGA